MRRAMTMVCDGFDIVVYVRIIMLSTLPMVQPPGYDMPQVRNHTSADKHLSFRIIINTPWVAKAMRYHFEFVFNRMVPPNSAIDLHAFAFQYIFRKWIIVFIDTAFALG